MRRSSAKIAAVLTLFALSGCATETSSDQEPLGSAQFFETVQLDGYRYFVSVQLSNPPDDTVRMAVVLSRLHETRPEDPEKARVDAGTLLARRVCETDPEVLWDLVYQNVTMIDFGCQYRIDLRSGMRFTPRGHTFEFPS